MACLPPADNPALCATQRADHPTDQNLDLRAGTCIDRTRDRQAPALIALLRFGFFVIDVLVVARHQRFVVLKDVDEIVSRRRLDEIGYLCIELHQRLWSFVGFSHLFSPVSTSRYDYATLSFIIDLQHA
jgi:hypothetical protein